MFYFIAVTTHTYSLLAVTTYVNVCVYACVCFFLKSHHIFFISVFNFSVLDWVENIIGFSFFLATRRPGMEILLLSGCSVYWSPQKVPSSRGFPSFFLRNSRRPQPHSAFLLCCLSTSFWEKEKRKWKLAWLVANKSTRHKMVKWRLVSPVCTCWFFITSKHLMIHF